MLAPREGGPAEQREVEHRAALQMLDEHERDQQHDGDDQEGDDLGRAPALFVALDERVHEQEQRAGERHEARPVDAGGVRVARVLDLRERR